MIRFGLAGAGVHGMRYARHLLDGDVAGARLTALCRRDVDAGRAFAQRHGLTFAPTPAELCTLADVDAVVLCLPPDLHATAARAALRAGRPVLVEKPLAHDLQAARQVAAAVERSGLPLMVAQTLRFDGVVRALRREAAGLGPLRLVAINQRFEPAERGWIDVPGPGGALLNTAVHGFDLLHFLTGCEPVAVTAELARAVTERTEDQLAVVVRLEPGGILATLDNCRATAGRSGRIEIAGERGQLAGDHVLRTLRRIRGREETDLGPVPATPTVPAVLDHFARCLESSDAPGITVRDGLRTMRCLEAARRSAAEGRRVALEELGG